MAPRPCNQCSAPVERGQKCARCTRPGYGNAERVRRRQTVEAHQRVYGNLCHGWGVPPHRADRLSADHLTPVAAGGAENGPLRVLCVSCNSRRGASEET